MSGTTFFSDCAKIIFKLSVFKSAVLCAAFLLFLPMFSAAVSIKKIPGADSMTYLSALSLDRGQRIKITSDCLSEDGLYGIVEFDGMAEGHKDNSLNGTLGIWLYMGAREGSRISQENPLPGWNIMLFLKSGQTPEQSAKMLAEQINSAPDRPYYAKAFCHKVFIYYRSYFEDAEAKKAAKKAVVMRKMNRAERIKNESRAGNTANL